MAIGDKSGSKKEQNRKNRNPNPRAWMNSGPRLACPKWQQHWFPV